MLRIPVTHNLMCEIKQEMDYCARNPEHCIITRDGNVVAIVWLNPVNIEKGADLLSWEIEDVINVVTENQYELEEEYRRIVNDW